MQVFFDKFIPEDYHEIGHIMVEGCIDEYGWCFKGFLRSESCYHYKANMTDNKC